jgi:hypothetical protein
MTRAVAFSSVVLALGVLCSTASAAPVILKGPYAQNVSGTEATIICETSEKAGITLRYGYTPEADTGSMRSIGVLHVMPITGLQPGKKLYYTIKGASPNANRYAEGGMNSPAGSVQLPPFPAKFVFAVFGDTRSGHLEHAVLSKLIESHNPMFVINTGDLVSNGASEADWQVFFDVEHALLSSTTEYPVMGNHDERRGMADLFFKYFRLPGGERGKAYYKFRHGNVEVVVMDSEIESGFLGFSDAQEAWLKKSLETAGAGAGIDHRFVVLHQGPYASAPGRTGNSAIRGLLGEFKKSKVSAIFSGHDHNYERGLSGNGITYVVTGGGGAPLYDVGVIGRKTLPLHVVKANRKAFNFVLVTIHGSWARFEARDISNTLIDSWEYGAARE